MTGKQYASVSEMVRAMCDPEFADRFEECIAGRRIVKQLVVMRGLQSLDQLDIVRQTPMVLTQVSALENGTDADARLGDLQAYANAVGCELEVRLVPKAGVDDQGGKA